MDYPTRRIGPAFGIGALIACLAAGFVVLRMFPRSTALPMEVIAPVLGIGAIISFIVAGIVVVRLVPSRVGRLQAGEAERAQLLDELHSRMSELDHLNQRVTELEERVDFTERLLAKPPEADRAKLP